MTCSCFFLVLAVLGEFKIDWSTIFLERIVQTLKNLFNYIFSHSVAYILVFSGRHMDQNPANGGL
jgi:hypothetical protein